MPQVEGEGGRGTGSAADVEAARSAWHEAPRTCAPGCAPYHRLWPTLRLLGLGSGPDRHRTRFVGAVREAVADIAPEPPTIAVVGQADHAMAALVLDALDGAPARLRLLDRCPTPVDGARRWIQAHRPDVDVTVEVSDARLEPLPGASVVGADLAVSHSFLSQVPATDRVALLRAIGHRLAPGGCLVTNTRLARPGDDGRFGADAVDQLRQAVLHAGRSHPARLPAPLPAVVDAVDAYVAAVTIHPIVDEDELRDAVAAAGLVLEALVPVALDGATTGPGSAQAATYVELVARRPAVS